MNPIFARATDKVPLCRPASRMGSRTKRSSSRQTGACDASVCGFDSKVRFRSPSELALLVFELLERVVRTIDLIEGFVLSVSTFSGKAVRVIVVDVRSRGTYGSCSGSPPSTKDSTVHGSPARCS
jgi:hypothetical protein